MGAMLTANLVSSEPMYLIHEVCNMNLSPVVGLIAVHRLYDAGL